MLPAKLKTLAFGSLELFCLGLLLYKSPVVGISIYLVVTLLTLLLSFNLRKSPAISGTSPLYIFKTQSALVIALLALVWPLCYIKTLIDVFVSINKDI